MKEDAGSSLQQSYSHHGRESTERSGFLRGPMLPTYLPTTSLFLPRPARHNTAAAPLPRPLAEGCMYELFALCVQSCLSCEMCKGELEDQARLWLMEEHKEEEDLKGEGQDQEERTQEEEEVEGRMGGGGGGRGEVWRRGLRCDF